MKIGDVKAKTATVLLHPYALCIFNFLILILFYSSIKATWFHLNPDHHFEEAIDLWEGVGTILLGFGVVLEERTSLHQIVGYRPLPGTTELEGAVERVSHDYGVLFVVVGVLIELFAWLVKIPNDLLDTYAIELLMLNIAALAAAFGAFLQLKFFFDILGAHTRRARSSRA